MKLAEALALRADHQKRLEQLKQRLVRNAKVQEGDEPAEDPRALLAELERVAAELAALIRRVNHANATTPFESGTLTDALAERDVLRWRAAAHRELAQAAAITQDRFSRSEVKFRSTVNVADVQRRADDLARDARALDVRIQATNWTTELPEE